MAYGPEEVRYIVCIKRLLQWDAFVDVSVESLDEAGAVREAVCTLFSLPPATREEPLSFSRPGSGPVQGIPIGVMDVEWSSRPQGQRFVGTVIVRSVKEEDSVDGFPSMG